MPTIGIRFSHERGKSHAQELASVLCCATQATVVPHWRARFHEGQIVSHA
jgi:hypothetical protein